MNELDYKRSLKRIEVLMNLKTLEKVFKEELESLVNDIEDYEEDME